MKAKSVPSKSIKVTKKSKKSVPKPRSPSPVLQDKSAERTVTKVQEDNSFKRYLRNYPLSIHF